ncbi:hypothetical protein [Fibrobacter sp. UWEL]|uniref:hypothetical protein n=1 Tax=Fibrobacter sp. UWEL TaxID=1896209 RepID=UPI0011603871|nr:hypothetical protein [Fibrobacter sp. UWEL]
MRKILVVILFAVVGASADRTLPKMNLNVATIGYSSLGRVEASALHFRMGESFFSGINPLRFDIRTSYDKSEYDEDPISLGSPIVTVPAAGLAFLCFANKAPQTVGIVSAVAAFLASGELGYRFLNFDYFRLSVFESHVFEWWLYKKNNKWHMDEAGWGQELGLEMEFPHVMLDGGAQFEITNKQKGMGWFVRVKLIDIFELFQ